jgi:hypothetical protein
VFQHQFADALKVDNLRAAICGVDPAGASQVLHDLPLTGFISSPLARAQSGGGWASGRLIFSLHRYPIVDRF